MTIRGTIVMAVLPAGLCFASATADAGMIHFTQGSQRAQGYLALPAGKGTHAAVIVIHEWWGLNAWVKAQTDSLAKHGYVALAPDLYGGKIAYDADTAHQLMSGLGDDAALSVLQASADFLRSRDDVRAHAVGVIGWCMGGKYSIRLAATDPGIRACVMYYGAPLVDSTAIRAIQAPVLGHFGGNDKGPSPDQVKEFEKALRKAGKQADFKTYPGAGHAFANVNNPWGGYREEAARDAWKRTVLFFERELKKGSVPKRPR